MKCPECKARTEVIQTVQQLDATYRRRRCLSPRCNYRFTTHEKTQSQDIELRPVSTESILAKLKQIHPRVGAAYDAEALAAAIATDRRRAEIKRRQRLEEGDDDYESDFEPAPTRLDMEGLKRELGK